jgi:cytidylate kinase
MSVPSHPVVAIDGTAASGKSTFARALALRLGSVYVNTGVMYRGVTWYLDTRGVPLEDPGAVAQALATLALETRLEQGEAAFLIAGHDPVPHVRNARVNSGVSLVSQVAAVRQRLVAEQQALAAQAPLVMEGRDIGTVVFPHTPYKFYIDADAAVRAERRQAQGETDVVLQRDSLDSSRTHSPLTCAPDALRLDSGVHSVQELVETALAHLASRGWSHPIRPAKE